MATGTSAFVSSAGAFERFSAASVPVAAASEKTSVMFVLFADALDQFWSVFVPI
jgi:hypothetical protein